MARRSLADVPNRVVRIFLEAAGSQYDLARGFPPYVRPTSELIDRFRGACAYCGRADELIEEHVVPIKRESVGLHAWGNVVPACRDCNRGKGRRDWRSHIKTLSLREDDLLKREQELAVFIAEFRYDPNVRELRAVCDKLYELTDRQTRGLIDFALVASAGILADLHQPPDQASQLAAATGEGPT